MIDESKLHDSIGRLTYAKFGLLQDEFGKAVDAHRRTYSLLKSLKKGSISLDSVTIIDGGWEIEIIK